MSSARSDEPRVEPAHTINNYAKGTFHAADNGDAPSGASQGCVEDRDDATYQADELGGASRPVRASFPSCRVGAFGKARAMTQPPVDARELLRGLHSFTLDYVLFGALAMLFYGYVRTT